MHFIIIKQLLNEYVHGARGVKERKRSPAN